MELALLFDKGPSTIYKYTDASIRVILFSEIRLVCGGLFLQNTKFISWWLFLGEEGNG